MGSLKPIASLCPIATICTYLCYLSQALALPILRICPVFCEIEFIQSVRPLLEFGRDYKTRPKIPSEQQLWPGWSKKRELGRLCVFT